MSTPYRLPHYTYSDYVIWEGRWELIEGIAYAMSPAPSFQHQRVSQKIARELEDGLAGCKHCRAVLPVDWKISEDTVVQPDNLVICHQPTAAYLTKAPALIFEVLSPSTAEKDRYTKFAIYEREGVPWYCIVDPDGAVAKVYRLHEGRYIKHIDATDEVVEFDLGKCLMRFDFGRIWGT